MRILTWNFQIKTRTEIHICLKNLFIISAAKATVSPVNQSHLFEFTFPRASRMALAFFLQHLHDHVYISHVI